jgi:hypothetical protein
VGLRACLVGLLLLPANCWCHQVSGAVGLEIFDALTRMARCATDIVDFGSAAFLISIFHNFFIRALN